MWLHVVVELSERLDLGGHFQAVGGEVAPERFDLDRSVVALDHPVGLRVRRRVRTWVSSGRDAMYRAKAVALQQGPLSETRITG